MRSYRNERRPKIAHGHGEFLRHPEFGWCTAPEQICRRRRDDDDVRLERAQLRADVSE
jgi:hypothetical protein